MFNATFYAWLLLLVLLIVGIADIAICLSGEAAATVSEVLHNVSRRFPPLLLLLGILLGHLFWPQFLRSEREVEPKKDESSSIAKRPSGGDGPIGYPVFPWD